MSGPLWPDVNLAKSHPGTLNPSDATGWVTMCAPGDPIQFDDANGNDWQRITSGREPFSYRIDVLGMIHFRGAIQKTDDTTQALGSPIITMPVGLRIATGVKIFEVPLVQNTLTLRSHGHVAIYGQSTALPGQVRFIAGVTDLDFSNILYLVDA